MDNNNNNNNNAQAVNAAENNQRRFFTIFTMFFIFYVFFVSPPSTESALKPAPAPTEKSVDLPPDLVSKILSTKDTDETRHLMAWYASLRSIQARTAALLSTRIQHVVDAVKPRLSLFDSSMLATTPDPATLKTPPLFTGMYAGRWRRQFALRTGTGDEHAASLTRVCRCINRRLMPMTEDAAQRRLLWADLCPGRVGETVVDARRIALNVVEKTKREIAALRQKIIAADGEGTEKHDKAEAAVQAAVQRLRGRIDKAMAALKKTEAAAAAHEKKEHQIDEEDCASDVFDDKHLGPWVGSEGAVTVQVVANFTSVPTPLTDMDDKTAARLFRRPTDRKRRPDPDSSAETSRSTTKDSDLAVEYWTRDDVTAAGASTGHGTDEQTTGGDKPRRQGEVAHTGQRETGRFDARDLLPLPETEEFVSLQMKVHMIPEEPLLNAPKPDTVGAALHDQIDAQIYGSSGAVMNGAADATSGAVSPVNSHDGRKDEAWREAELAQRRELGDKLIGTLNTKERALKLHGVLPVTPSLLRQALDHAGNYSMFVADHSRSRRHGTDTGARKALASEDEGVEFDEAETPSFLDRVKSFFVQMAFGPHAVEGRRHVRVKEESLDDLLRKAIIGRAPLLYKPDESDDNDKKEGKDKEDHKDDDGGKKKDEEKQLKSKARDRRPLRIVREPYWLLYGDHHLSLRKQNFMELSHQTPARYLSWSNITATRDDVRIDRIIAAVLAEVHDLERLVLGKLGADEIRDKTKKKKSKTKDEVDKTEKKVDSKHEDSKAPALSKEKENDKEKKEDEAFEPVYEPKGSDDALRKFLTPWTWLPRGCRTVGFVAPRLVDSKGKGQRKTTSEVAHERALEVDAGMSVQVTPETERMVGALLMSCPRTSQTGSNNVYYNTERGAPSVVFAYTFEATREVALKEAGQMWWLSFWVVVSMALEFYAFFAEIMDIRTSQGRQRQISYLFILFLSCWDALAFFVIDVLNHGPLFPFVFDNKLSALATVIGFLHMQLTGNVLLIVIRGAHTRLHADDANSFEQRIAAYHPMRALLVLFVTFAVVLMFVDISVFINPVVLGAAMCFFAPQIILNFHHKDITRPSHRMTILTSMSKLLFLFAITVTATSTPLHSGYRPGTFMAGLVVIVVQLVILYLQRRFGPRAFLPAFLLPKRHEYLVPRADVTRLAIEDSECAICQLSVIDGSEGSAEAHSPAPPDQLTSSVATPSHGPVTASGAASSGDSDASREGVGLRQRSVHGDSPGHPPLHPATTRHDEARSNAADDGRSGGIGGAPGGGGEAESEEVWRTPCNHVFHKACLEQWMAERMECPLCRKPLPTP